MRVWHVLGVVGWGLACAPEPLPASYEGTQVAFDFDAAAAGGPAFYEAPFPSDRRLTDAGGPPMTSIPGVPDVPLAAGVAASAEELRGFPTMPVAWFRFDGPLASVVDGRVWPADDADAPLFLVDVDPDSDERGRRVPVVAEALAADDFVVPHLLAVAPRPGFILRGDTTYAFVVRRSLGDADGAPLGTPAGVLTALRGERPADDPLGDDAALLADTLPDLGVDVEEVAAFTVFTTGDAVRDLHELTESLREVYAPAIEDLALVEGRGATHPNVCELRGTIRFPQFQVGTPPFNSDGLFTFDDDGLPVEQRAVDVPVVVAVPKSPMPDGGYPLGLYFHGSGGTADQLVVRGPQDRSGEVAVGYGPSYVLARHGIASAGSAHPVNPERVPGASAFAYLNLVNPKAFRDTFRQGVIEQRLYLDALLDLAIPAEALEGCDGPSLPAGESAFRFDGEQVVAMGQSMGGMYTNLVGAVEPRIRATVPTGAGGHWTRFILLTSLLGEGVPEELLGGLLGIEAPISWMHPALVSIQTAWEAAEPQVFTPRLGSDPLPGHPIRPVYQPVGLDDSYFPPPVFDAMALAYGNTQAGTEVWPTMQEALALAGQDGLEAYPVADNRVSRGGEPYTGLVVQYAGDGFSDPHVIFTQLDEVKHQYGCFFATFLSSGTAVVPEGGAVDDPCPGP